MKNKTETATQNGVTLKMNIYPKPIKKTKNAKRKKSR